MGPRGRKAIPKDGPLAFPCAGFYNLAQASSKAAGHMSRCCITPSRFGVRQPDKRSLAAGMDSFFLLWVFHEALPTGCVEFLLVDGSVIVSIDLRKVHDVRSGVCLC